MFRILAPATIATSLALSAVYPALAQDTGVSGTLVLYTSQPNEDAQRTVDAFTAAYPNVEVDWIRDGTAES